MSSRLYLPTLALWVSVSACGAGEPEPTPFIDLSMRSALHEPRVLPAAHLPPAGQGYDTNCDGMATVEADILPSPPGELPYFDRPIPRRLHQIWYGPPHPLFHPRMQSWKTYADIFGYAYKLWTHDDDAIIALIMPEKNYQILRFYRDRGDYKAVSDVLRLSILNTFGGIYLDSDLQPPSDSQGVFDLDEWVPMTNIAAIAESGARETGSMAAFYTNCFLAAAVRHPLIDHLVNTLPRNHVQWQARFHTVAEYNSGPFFLTRSAAGAITTLRMQEGYAYHLFGGLEQGPFAWGLPASGDAQAGLR